VFVQRPAAAHPNNGLDAVVSKQLVHVNRKARLAHSRAHCGHGLALVGARVAVHAADFVDQLRLLEEGFGDEFGPKWIPRQKDLRCDVALGSGDMYAHGTSKPEVYTRVL